MLFEKYVHTENTLIKEFVTSKHTAERVTKLSQMRAFQKFIIDSEACTYLGFGGCGDLEN